MPYKALFIYSLPSFLLPARCSFLLVAPFRNVIKLDDRGTDKASYRDARTYLKNGPSMNRNLNRC